MPAGRLHNLHDVLLDEGVHVDRFELFLHGEQVLGAGHLHDGIDRVRELLRVQGQDVYCAEPIRHMKTSAQQGFKSSLAETLLKVRR